MYHRHDLSGAIPALADCPALRFFIDEHVDGLHNAASLLGGARGARLVDTIIDQLANEARPGGATWSALRELLGLLTLEHVHDESREEAALFAQLDPANPIVDEICLLTDQLRDALEEALRDNPDTLQHGIAM